MACIYEGDIIFGEELLRLTLWEPVRVASKETTASSTCIIAPSL